MSITSIIKTNLKHSSRYLKQNIKRHFICYKNMDSIRKEMDCPKESNDLSSSFCKVCGEKAKNFVVYGGVSCGCCRQFFRRTVVKMSR